MAAAAAAAAPASALLINKVILISFSVITSTTFFVLLLLFASANFTAISAAVAEDVTTTASSAAAVAAVADNVTTTPPPPPRRSELLELNKPINRDATTKSAEAERRQRRRPIPPLPKQIYCQYRRLARSDWKNATIQEKADYVTLYSLVRLHGTMESVRNPGSLTPRSPGFDCGPDLNFKWTEAEIVAALNSCCS